MITFGIPAATRAPRSAVFAHVLPRARSAQARRFLAGNRKGPGKAQRFQWARSRPSNVPPSGTFRDLRRLPNSGGMQISPSALRMCSTRRFSASRARIPVA